MLLKAMCRLLMSTPISISGASSSECKATISSAHIIVHVRLDFSRIPNCPVVIVAVVSNNAVATAATNLWEWMLLQHAHIVREEALVTTTAITSCEISTNHIRRALMRPVSVSTSMGVRWSVSSIILRQVRIIICFTPPVVVAMIVGKTVRMVKVLSL